ncbi:MAG: iron ABC transporter permease [Sphaerochaetaceae bacterium]|nr:iron ABC transporter permease [Sphaerochaetaceae bacterium]
MSNDKSRTSVDFRHDPDHPVTLLAGFIILFIFIFFLSFFVGRYPIKPITLIKVLLSKIFYIEPTWPSTVENVIFKIRMPRILSSAIIGGALSVSGLAYQGMFKNPMVSPDVLGTSAGAGFGASLGILLGLSYFSTSALSFICGLVAVILVTFISGKLMNQKTLGLILGGIMISSIFTSGTSFVKLVADTDDALPAITYWLMGSLASVKMSDIKFLIIPIIIGLLPIILLRWKLNLLTLDEDEAMSLGINTILLRKVVIFGSTLMTAACVGVSGHIGWVGLVIPHFTRMIVGCDYRHSVPISILMGSSFLMLVDTLSRTVTTGEIPLGILTSFIGAPFFLYLMIREGKK